jgi:hypothetical protein
VAQGGFRGLSLETMERSWRAAKGRVG